MGNRRGRYLALEGTEGVGKTTLAVHLAARLSHMGVEVKLVREPGGTALGEKIRSLLLHGGGMSEWAEALLFAAQRSELARQVIRPALERGAWVISDRSVYSSLAYQGHARGLGVDGVREVNAHALGETTPDMVLWLEMDPEKALARQEGRDRIGGEGPALHRAVWEGYRNLWMSEGDVVKRIDASLTIGQSVDTAFSFLRSRRWLPVVASENDEARV
ncbi:MAG: dTMP kinase [bacterium]|nr:dTMP kinase [Acidimicrobiia bacterium]MCY4651049.1 dTMP kinase [bacterium]